MAEADMTADPTMTPGRSILMRIADLRAWLFLILLLVFFEVWARFAYGQSFVFNLYNVQSIGVFATAPLLLALGQTFVIISAGIDLSVGFTMGLAAVVSAHAANLAASALGLDPLPAMMVGILSGIGVAFIPGLSTAADAQLRAAFIGTPVCSASRGAAYLIAGGMTVPVSNPWLLDRQRPHLRRDPILVLITASSSRHALRAVATRFGQHTYAPARRNARPSAPASTSTTMRLYLLSAVCAGPPGAPFRPPRRRRSRRASRLSIDRRRRHRPAPLRRLALSPARSLAPLFIAVIQYASSSSMSAVWQFARSASSSSSRCSSTRASAG